jgi:hypothetical protein
MLYLINQVPPAFNNNELVMIDMDDEAFDKMVLEQITN